MRRVLFALSVVGGLILLSACSVPDPSITFFSSGASVAVAPIQYCDINEEHCQADGTAVRSLAVTSGKPVQISAPAQVANSPWQVAARFTDATGTQYVACSPLFQPGVQFAWTVHPQHTRDRLVLIEVYQASATLEQLPNGDLETPIRGTWVLTAASGSTVLPKPGDNLCGQ